MSGYVDTLLEGHFPFPKTDGKLKEVLWHTSLFWKSFLLVPEDAYGIEYLPSLSGSPI